MARMENEYADCDWHTLWERCPRSKIRIRSAVIPELQVWLLAMGRRFSNAVSSIEAIPLDKRTPQMAGQLEFNSGAVRTIDALLAKIGESVKIGDFRRISGMVARSLVIDPPPAAVPLASTVRTHE